MIIIIGIIGLKKTQSFNDYFLVCNVGPWMTAFTYEQHIFCVLFIGFAEMLLGFVFPGFGLPSECTNWCSFVLAVGWSKTDFD
jgi:SSS family solute:Na+ symporter/sodium/proline symporter